uniref:BTB domain-containing protein n=1 Tax=Setaria digitata TaxID=48799 RepID=A0A915PLV4_9BILA
MSLITTPFHNLGITLGAPYRLGHPENDQPPRRIYPNFSTDYMKGSDMLVIFTHCYYHKMRKDEITTELGRSLFATVHGIRYIEWTVHIKKLKREFSVELVRQTDTNIKGEYRVQFSAQSRNARKIETFSAQWHELKHRVEFVPNYAETLAELYQSDEFNDGQLKIEIRLAFALQDFIYIVPDIDLDPLISIETQYVDDERLQSSLFIRQITKTMFNIICTDGILSYDRYCLYITCRYFHEYMDCYPTQNAIKIQFHSTIIQQVMSFAFNGMCRVRYYGGSLNSSDFLNFQQFLACLNLLKPLMYRELLQMYDDEHCRMFQKLCDSVQPPCEANTLQFLRIAIRWGFPKLEACTIARIVGVFPDTYCLHLNANEQPYIVQEMIQARLNYEMCMDHEDWADFISGQKISPLEQIELLKSKCKQVYKWIGQGLMSTIPEPGPPPPALPEQNLFEISPILQTLFTHDAMEELD